MRASRRMWDATDSAEARASRIVWAALASTTFGVVVLARVLVPDPAGFGTHEQLGLPPCPFRMLTDLPCPGCGLTTAFAHMARFDALAATRAHPLGVPLFVSTLAGLSLSLAGVWNGWHFGHVVRTLRLPEAVLAGTVALALVWAVRLFGVW